MREWRNHYTDEQWVDFIRDTGQAETNSAIRSHLELGCSECAATHRLLADLHRMGLEEAPLPLMDASKRAKSLFEPVRQDRNWIDSLRQVAASLVCEMRQDWVPAGVRSGPAPSERLLFRAGDYSVDLNLETATGASHREIVGQIANEQDRDDNVEGIAVQLVSTGKTLGETSTNRFGEFVMECPAGKGTLLRLALRARGERIDLPLNPAKSKKK